MGTQNRFTGGVLTARTGRDDGETEVVVPTSAVRDEKTGLVYAFPLDADPNVLAETFNRADQEGALASEMYYPDGQSDSGDKWLPEHEPYTWVTRDTFVQDTLDKFMDLVESMGADEEAKS